MHKSLAHMFLTTLIGGLIAGLVVAFFFLLIFDNHQKETPKAMIAQPGMTALAQYRCPRGEIKKTFVRGKEDGFSPDGHEPTHIYEKLLEYGHYSYEAAKARDYDEGGLDKYLFDYFELPTNISGGLFVIGIKSIRMDDNENLSLGDMYTLDTTRLLVPINAYDVQLLSIDKAPEWSKVSEHVYQADLAELKRAQTVTSAVEFDVLLAYIRNSKNKSDAFTRVDIAVGEDTMVDFTAFAVCVKPDNSRGVTFIEAGGFKDKIPTTSLLSCRADIRHRPCDAIHGDTVCSTELPLACFKPGNHAGIPAELSSQTDLRRFWSGGEVAYTLPVRGDQFKSIADANGFCASEFGKDWRVVSWHDGGVSMVISKTSQRKPGLRAWIDIKDQPYGTCWSR